MATKMAARAPALCGNGRHTWVTGMDPRYQYCKTCKAAKPAGAPDPEQQRKDERLKQLQAAHKDQADRMRAAGERVERERERRRRDRAAETLEKAAGRLDAKCERRGKIGERARKVRRALRVLALALRAGSEPVDLSKVHTQAIVVWLLEHDDYARDASTVAGHQLLVAGITEHNYAGARDALRLMVKADEGAERKAARLAAAGVAV